tara:strand:- start:3006 stop:3521 length:516 start_codon:yes stop_codon:yes gene_type:complete
MGEFDFIGPAQTVKKTTTYNQKELYEYLRSWFEDRHYIVVEKDYSERISKDGKRVYAFEWWIEKKIETLTKIVMELSYKSDAEEQNVTANDGSIKKVQKGEVAVTIRAFVYRDAEGDWALNKKLPQKRLLRDFLDKVVKKPRLTKYEGQLKKDMRAVFSDIKIYLKTHKYN